MRFFFVAAWPLLVLVAVSSVKAANMVCFYDTSSIRDVTQAIQELDPAIQFCNFLVYGYAGIDAGTYQIKTLDRGLNYDLYHAVNSLKSKHPHLRVLLSVGGYRDVDEEQEQGQEEGQDEVPSTYKYLLLLEEMTHRNAFINSAQNFVATYGFDGLDLAWQFPPNPPKVVHSGLSKAWHALKDWFSGRKVVDEKAAEHKQQFATLVRELSSSLRSRNAILTLTMLPHVDAELFIDIPAILPQVDFVTLGTFDFLTPHRDPKIADHTAPLYEPYERNPTHNVDWHVQYWLNNSAPANKLNVGVPAYGRSWVMTKDSGITGYPPIPAGGPAPAANRTNTAGLLSWPEICEKIHQNKNLTGEAAPLRKVGDPIKRYGSYAYRAADEQGDYGLWVSYEEPATAAVKAGYVHVKELGGVALFDLLTDDTSGSCGEGKYPILRSIKFKL